MENEKDFIYLTKYQMFAFVFRMKEIRKNNPYFKDNIFKAFEEYMLKRTAEIAMTYPQIKLKIVPNANKYKISKSMFDYLTRLTSIDVFDRKTMRKYKVLTKVYCDLVYEKFEKSLFGENTNSSKTK